jgi:hypothetical protein
LVTGSWGRIRIDRAIRRKYFARGSGVNQTRLAEALKLSRQTLHNYRESYREFGVHGLLHGYSPAGSKDAARHRHLHLHKRRPGAKARELEAMRRAKREQAARGAQAELSWDGEHAPAATFALAEPAIEATLGAALAMPAPAPAPSAASVTERPYAQSHAWQASRYAGVFPIVMVLVSQWQWLARVMGLFGNGWRVFMVFVLMAVRNLRSIEQLKHARREEAALSAFFGCDLCQPFGIRRPVINRAFAASRSARPAPTAPR